MAGSTPWRLIWSLSLAACTHPAAKTADPLVCPTSTKPARHADSDVGWGEVEETLSCERSDGVLEGPAVETVCGGSTRAGTFLIGRYSRGRRVGEWKQLDASKRAVLGSFTFDDEGSGEETIVDAAGHSRRGLRVRGERDGAFVHRDSDGKVVATETWAHGAFVKREGRVAWDPPMVDPADACPTTPRADAGDDGCPEVVVPR